MATVNYTPLYGIGVPAPEEGVPGGIKANDFLRQLSKASGIPTDEILSLMDKNRKKFTDYGIISGDTVLSGAQANQAERLIRDLSPTIKGKEKAKADEEKGRAKAEAKAEKDAKKAAEKQQKETDRNNKIAQQEQAMKEHFASTTDYAINHTAPAATSTPAAKPATGNGMMTAQDAVNKWLAYPNVKSLPVEDKKKIITEATQQAFGSMSRETAAMQLTVKQANDYIGLLRKYTESFTGSKPAINRATGELTTVQSDAQTKPATNNSTSVPVTGITTKGATPAAKPATSTTASTATAKPATSTTASTATAKPATSTTASTATAKPTAGTTTGTTTGTTASTAPAAKPAAGGSTSDATLDALRAKINSATATDDDLRKAYEYQKAGKWKFGPKANQEFARLGLTSGAASGGSTAAGGAATSTGSTAATGGTTAGSSTTGGTAAAAGTTSSSNGRTTRAEREAQLKEIKRRRRELEKAIKAETKENRKEINRRVEAERTANKQQKKADAAFEKDMADYEANAGNRQYSREYYDKKDNLKPANKKQYTFIDPSLYQEALDRYGNGEKVYYGENGEELSFDEFYPKLGKVKKAPKGDTPSDSAVKDIIKTLSSFRF